MIPISEAELDFRSWPSLIRTECAYLSVKFEADSIAE